MELVPIFNSTDDNEEEPPRRAIMLLSSAFLEAEPDEPTVPEVFTEPPMSTTPLEEIPISHSLPVEIIFSDHEPVTKEPQAECPMSHP